jgi:hypothetical protein
MKVALLIFFGLITIGVMYAPFLMSGRMSDLERSKEKDERASKET